MPPLWGVPMSRISLRCYIASVLAIPTSTTSFKIRFRRLRCCGAEGDNSIPFLKVVTRDSKCCVMCCSSSTTDEAAVSNLRRRATVNSSSQDIVLHDHLRPDQQCNSYLDETVLSVYVPSGHCQCRATRLGRSYAQSIQWLQGDTCSNGESIDHGVLYTTMRLAAMKRWCDVFTRSQAWPLARREERWLR